MRLSLFAAASFCASLIPAPLSAQQILGAITGTVKDASGAAVPGVDVKARNTATDLAVRGQTQGNGAYLLPNLPIGTYELSFAKQGLDTESHTQVIVQGDRTTTVDGSLKVGATSTTVEVTDVALMNQVDTTNGYVVDQLTVQQTPLGTGSFTQLALLSPGVNADFLSGSGTNAGLGNQAIFSNGQRDTSNSFSLNGISTNNLFHGNSTSQVADNRFVLNTGETFGAGGEIITSTSVYSAIGEALPTPAPETIQEIRVNAAMYDASQGAKAVRILFRGPFQLRFDASLGKMFDITERVKARFSWDAFDVFNSASFDTPNSNVTFFPDYGPPPSFPPVGQLGIIQHTIGSPRFMQLSLHVLF